MRKAFDKRRMMMFRMLTAIDGIQCLEPEGAFYAFPDVTAFLGGEFETSADLCDAILDETGAALVPGESFGLPGFVRLSYALGESAIETGLSRIAEMFGRL